MASFLISFWASIHASFYWACFFWDVFAVKLFELLLRKKLPEKIFDFSQALELKKILLSAGFSFIIFCYFFKSLWLAIVWFSIGLSR